MLPFLVRVNKSTACYSGWTASDIMYIFLHVNHVYESLFPLDQNPFKTIFRHHPAFQPTDVSCAPFDQFTTRTHFIRANRS